MVGAEGEEYLVFSEQGKKTGKQFCFTAPVSLKPGDNWSFLIFVEMKMASTLAIVKELTCLGIFPKTGKIFLIREGLT